MAKQQKVCPPQVTVLVEHLKSTGTGSEKLDNLIKLGQQFSHDLDEFLEALPSSVPLATIAKIDDFICRHPGWADTQKAKGLRKIKDDQQKALQRAEQAAMKPPVKTEPVKDEEENEQEEEKTEGSETEGADDEVSEVSTLNATEAKDAISRMRSVEKLQHIVANDERKTVKEAAEFRLEELKEAQGKE